MDSDFIDGYTEGIRNDLALAVELGIANQAKIESDFAVAPLRAAGQRYLDGPTRRLSQLRVRTILREVTT